MTIKNQLVQRCHKAADYRRSAVMFAAAIVLTLVCTHAVLAADAILSWDANTETDLAGYRIHYGTTPGSYPTVIDVGRVTTYTVTGLGPGTYYFVVTAYNTTGAESEFSNQGSKVIADTVPPVIAVIAASSITDASATITWATDEPASGLVEYGTSTGYGLQTTENISLVTAHNQGLTGLQVLTAYHYRVVNRDAAGNLAVSGDRTFTTLATSDTAAPVISGVAAGTVTSTSATITWTTNEAATTQVQYGTTTAYGSTTALNSTLLTAHSQALTSLAAATTYQYRVLSRNAAGNLATSGNFTVTTLATADTTAPTISAVAAGSVTSGSATITWTTNEAATTQVQYGSTTAYDATTALNSTLLTTHSQALTGLAPATTYQYRVLSRDAAGNLATSANFTVTTLATSDTTAPTISAMAAGSVTSNSATIAWTTNEAATTQVQYGTTTAYGATTSLNSTLLTAHSQALTGLAAATTYHYRVLSRDAAGNLATSGDNAFATAGTSGLINVARNATATASTQNTSSTQTASKAIDGVVSGYPTDSTREWATIRQLAGAWIRLTWTTPQSISQFVLHDRINLTDQMTGGTLQFSDGTSVPVGPLPNDGSAYTVTFPAKTVTWAQLTVTSATGQNTGLAEFEVYGTSMDTVNAPPLITAGPTASSSMITDSQTSNLSVTATDSNGDSLTYTWSATGGSVTGSGATAVYMPPRITTVTVLRVDVVVSDGRGGSTIGSVTITVNPSGALINVARNATATASTQNTSTTQTASKAIDGVVSGYPTDYTREWATIRQLAGAWIRLTWSSPQMISRIVLHDRINSTDRVTGGTLQFSDGTSVPVGPLPNDGSAYTVTFPAKTVTWVTFTITSATGANTGLAEFGAY